jgi:transposase
MAEPVITQVEEGTQTEVWMPVVGREDFYSVSSLGRLRSEYATLRHPPRILDGYVDAAGYLRLALTKPKTQTLFLHHIVADAFIGPRPAGLVVNHMNGIKTDCRSVNLEYTTQGDNQRHAYRNLLRKEPIRITGFDNYSTKLSELHVRAICLLRVGGMQCNEISQIFDVSESHVASITRGDRRSDVAAQHTVTAPHRKRKSRLEKNDIEKIVSQFDNAEKAILESVCGDEYQTREQIALRLGVTEAKIQYTEKKAKMLLSKLRTCAA